MNDVGILRSFRKIGLMEAEKDEVLRENQENEDKNKIDK